MSAKQVAEAMASVKQNASRLRSMAQSETDQNVKKLLLEAAHHFDVGVAELEYITTEATVSI